LTSQQLKFVQVESGRITPGTYDQDKVFLKKVSWLTVKYTTRHICQLFYEQLPSDFSSALSYLDMVCTEPSLITPQHRQCFLEFLYPNNVMVRAVMKRQMITVV